MTVDAILQMVTHGETPEHRLRYAEHWAAVASDRYHYLSQAYLDLDDEAIYCSAHDSEGDETFTRYSTVRATMRQYKVVDDRFLEKRYMILPRDKIDAGEEVYRRHHGDFCKGHVIRTHLLEMVACAEAWMRRTARDVIRMRVAIDMGEVPLTESEREMVDRIRNAICRKPEIAAHDWKRQGF